MGPKADKRRSIHQETSVSLTDPINTEDWKCAVVLVVEGDERDAGLIRRFAEEVSRKARKEVKSIDFERDVIKFLKNFMSGEIGLRQSFLLNFSAIFEEAVEYVRNSEMIPVALMVKIIKVFIFMLRKEDEAEKKGKMLCRENPIEIMAEIPLMPFYGNEGIQKNEEGKGKSDRRKSIKNGLTTVKIKLPTPAKEDTKLLRRGEPLRDLNVIDDVPDNTFFQLYIALTGFIYPELALEMLKNEIPLHGVVCLHSSCPVKPITPSPAVKLDEFWNDFLQLLWSPQLTHHFKDVVFLVYNHAELPTDDAELRSFIFREVSFLMYDLSDLQYQLRHYLRHMRLWNVEEQMKKIELDSSELDQLPQHCVSIPFIMQNMLDNICGEDGEEADEVYSSESSVTWVASTLSTLVTRLSITPESRNSFSSLLPITSTLKLPTPRWSDIVDTDEKLLLYNKMLVLDELYDLEERSFGSNPEANSSTVKACSARKKRLHCINLDLEIQSLSEGFLAKFWMNYPVQEKGDTTEPNEITARLKYPDLTVNYILYIVWIIRMEEMTRESLDRVSTADSNSDISETRFTVTECSRIALQKMNRPSDFFSPPHLKIIPPELLTSLSAPQFRSRPRFSWTEKSFVSDFHIPVKYLQGEPMGVFDDLRNYLGEEAFSPMKDYQFIEVLNREDLIARIRETAPNYDAIRHAYLPLTDSIYVVMYDNPTLNGIQRETYNVMLTTPVGLRDFYNYILDDERDWLSEQKLEKKYGEKREKCPDSMYNPTPDFRSFTECDFWHENSIKFTSHQGDVMQRMQSFEPVPVKKRATEEKRASVQKSKSSVYAEQGEPYKFVGFDFEPGAVQYSGVETTFKGPDNCNVRASLQERLYGKQQLGVHVQHGGHNLHLYSYVCPEPHLDQPYACHVEYKNGTILAFSRRVLPEEDIPPEDGSSAIPRFSEDESFAYDMKISFPHGLTVTTVREQLNPCYIKQSYRKNSSQVAANEKSRLFLPNGNIVIMLTDNTVQVLKPDTSIVTASLDDLVLRSHSASEFSGENEGESGTESNQQLTFRSYTKISPNGMQRTVVNDQVTEWRQHQIIVKSEKETQQVYHRRMDGTFYLIMDNGSTCVEFPDGSKICTHLREEELCLDEEPSWDGEDGTGSIYNIVHKKIVMEHPDYATAIYDTRSDTWRLNLPSGSGMEIDSRGCYQAHIDDQTELDIDTKAIRMWRYGPRDEFTISTVADLTVFGKDPPGRYCTTTDCRGRRFTIESNGTCYVAENDVSNDYGSSTTFENQSEDPTQSKRYFVVNRDLSGFEIVHTRNVARDVESTEPDVIVHSQKLKTTPPTRYFAILKETESDSKSKWTVESVTPEARFTSSTPVTSTAYGKPPSWMHPFPKKKPKPPRPKLLHGRILLEIHPTECPDPNIRNTKFAYCDTSDAPETGPSLTDNVTEIMRRVANQSQEMLREIYQEAIRVRAKANRIPFDGGPQMEKYLNSSEYHARRRKHLKKCIRERKVPGYFHYPTGIAWQIIDTVIGSVITHEMEQQLQAERIPEDSTPSIESSEIEYDLEWSTEPSYSDLSRRSNVSGKTAPEITRPPICQQFLPSPRHVKSEPIYKVKDFTNPGDDLSYSPGYSFTPPSSCVCLFADEDILNLEKKTSENEEENSEIYKLQDLMNLGLV